MNFITDDIGEVVALMRGVDISYGQPMLDYIDQYNTPANAPLMPYYMYGHRLEIANRLLEKSQDSVYMYQKYPLIALRMDVPEDSDDGLNHYKLNIAIVTLTEKNWNAEERMTNVIKPVLAPLYDRFIRELGNVGLFTWEGDSRKPPHTAIIRPYWGTAQKEGNAANIFNDPLDAIEIVNLELIRSKNCKRQ